MSDKLKNFSRIYPQTEGLPEDTATDFWKCLYEAFKERLEKEYALTPRKEPPHDVD